ncbi:MAG: hypothetical protein CSB06_02045 [Bacteroidia bacterium]|nr:MAG: hypothetical protein CSB06_02045 [Bacteroidia bacterium]
MYIIQNLHKLDRMPENLREKIFEKLFQTAEIAKFSPEQKESYEDSLKHYRDLKNSMNTAKEEGLTEGIEKGRKEGALEEKKEVVRKALQAGLSDEMIQQLTGLSEDEIRSLRP